jgi:hypothetical protein
MTLIDLCRHYLEKAGVNTRGMSRNTIAEKALQMRGGGYAATGDFTVLLENTMHKTLLASYALAPDTWRRFCDVGSVSDFRAHNRYRSGLFGSLDTVIEGAEFTNKAVPTGEKETITATTKGNIVAITRQTLINDDLGAFVGLANKLGRAAGLTIEKAVYALLALNGGLGPNMEDGNPLFDATHNNLGTGAALSVASIDADAVVMNAQLDPSGEEFLDLQPSVLLLARGLLGAARVINESRFDNDGTEFEKPNAVVGLYDDIVGTPRLSGTRRYSFADPSTDPTLEVAFLDGQQTPVLETRDGFRIDGVEWKIRQDFGVAAVDFRTAVTNAGA